MFHKWFWATFERKLKFEHFCPGEVRVRQSEIENIMAYKKNLLAHWFQFGNVLQMILSYFWVKTKIWTFLPRWSQSAPKWHTLFHVHPLFSSLPAAFTSATPFHTSRPIRPSPGPRGFKASLRPSQHHVRTATAWRSIVVGVTGFKLMISMCSLIRWSCNLVEVLFEVLWTCVPKDFVWRYFVAEK